MDHWLYILVAMKQTVSVVIVLVSVGRATRRMPQRMTYRMTVQPIGTKSKNWRSLPIKGVSHISRDRSSSFSCENKGYVLLSDSNDTYSDVIFTFDSSAAIYLE